MTTIKTITIMFCCLFLLALALSFGYTHKVHLQGGCDINRQDMLQLFLYSMFNRFHFFFHSSRAQRLEFLLLDHGIFSICAVLL